MTAAIPAPLGELAVVAALVFTLWRLDVYVIRRRRARSWRATTDHYRICRKDRNA